MIKEDPRYSKFSSSDRVRRKVFLNTMMKELSNKYIRQFYSQDLDYICQVCLGGECYTNF